MTKVSTMSIMAEEVQRFNVEIIGIEIPEEPTRLSPKRKEASLDHLYEEVLEFLEAKTIEDEADALMDLTYVALGRLIEMGICPRALFEEVHAANMAKKRGANPRHTHGKGYDCVKPEGWRPPQVARMLAVSRDEVTWLSKNRSALVCSRSEETEDDA